MKKKISLILIVFSSFCFPPVLWSQISAFASSIPFETIEQGEISFYRYSDSSFCGSDILIKDGKTWEAFWTQHSAGIEPKPPLPAVDFTHEMVVATILGYQTSGGGPSIHIQEININESGRCILVMIEENETPGPLTVITNPFHIVRLKRLNLPSVCFEHQKP
jgi:hypothetical protein